MRFLGYVALAAVAVLAFLAAYYLVRWALSTIRQKRSSSRIRRADLSTPWKAYSRYNPDKSVHEVGVERVYDGLVLNRVGMYEFHSDIDTATVLNAEGDAIARAVRYNENRTGM